MAPVSPRQKSAKMFPSISVSLEPCAVARYNGNPPGHIRIHVIGTPPSRCWPAAPNARRDAPCEAA
jgi:hypothetical protein